MTALTVVYLKATRHVLAAVTSAAPPEGREPVKALVGTHLPWRGTGQASVDVAFPDHLLAAVTVNDNLPDISRSGVTRATPLIDPQAFQVVEDPQDPTHPKVEQFPPATSTTPTVSVALSAASGLTITPNHLSPFAPPRSAVVVLQKVTTPAQTGTILPVRVPASGTTIDTRFQANDTWSVFVFVQGMPPPAPISKQKL